jgi:hypothetical protein
MENEIVRTSKKTWASGIGAILYLVFIAVYFFWIGKSGVVAGSISLLLALFLILESVKKIHKYYILFTADSLSGYIDHSFVFSRNDIQAIWFTGTKDSKILHIIENNTGHDIRCNIFNYSQLDKTLRKYFPHDIYSEYAYLQVPLIQEWLNDEKKRIESIGHELIVKIRGMYIIPSLIVITFSILIILVLSASKSIISFEWAIPFGLLLLFGLTLLLGPVDRLLVTNDFIKYRHFFNEKVLFWNELTKLSMSGFGYRVVFHGKTTKITLPLSDNWVGKDKQLITELIDIKCKELNIPVDE